MAKQTINVGTGPNTKDGDSVRNAFGKVNQNFTELYTLVGQTIDGFIVTDIKGSVFGDDSTTLVDSISGNLNGNVIIGNSIRGGAIELSDNIISTTDSSAITIAQEVMLTSNLTMSGDIVPAADNAYDLGSPAKPWRSLYVSNSTIYIGGNSLGIDNDGELVWNNNRIAHAGGEFITLETLTDVNLGSPQAGDVLSFQGGYWTAATVDRLINGIHQLELVVSGETPYVSFPENNGANVLIQGNEISVFGNEAALSAAEDGVRLVANATATNGPRREWAFGTDGSLTIPGDIQSENDINITINNDDSSTYVWNFGQTGALTLPSTAGVVDRLYSDNGGYRTKLEKKIPSSPTAGAIAKLELDLDNGHIRLAIGTYTDGNDQWINTSTWAFRGDTGSLTLPSGGVISETVITDNPTIVIEPADAESPHQALYIKGGGAPVDYHLHLTTGDLTDTSVILGTDNHNVRTIVDGGIELNSFNYDTDAQRTLTFGTDGNLKSADGEPLQIFSTGASGAVSLAWSSSLNSPENIALIIANSPGAQISGAVDIVVGAIAGPNIWTFDPNGALTIPGDIQSEEDISIRINLSDSTQRVWRFGEDGDLTVPGSIQNGNSKLEFNTGGATNLTLAVGDLSWRIDSDGFLNAPNQRFIRFYDEYGAENGSIGGDNINHVVLSAGENKGIKVFTDDTTNLWIFGADGDLTIPGGISVAGILKIDDGVHEQFQIKADATGVVTHDCALGHIIYHTSPDDYFTVNLTNLNLASGYATSITVVMVQGATGYGPNALQIGGVAQTINWQGGSLPAAPTANGVDVLVFSILNNNGTYTVLAQVTGFNEVA